MGTKRKKIAVQSTRARSIAPGNLATPLAVRLSLKNRDNAQRQKGEEEKLKMQSAASLLNSKGNSAVYFY